jgi:hypothetical protein
MKLKNEKKALQMFCNEDSFKDAYRQPFINDKNNGRVIASNGYIMASVDPKLLRCKYKHMEQRMPYYDFERKDFATVVEFANFDKAYNRLALIPEKVSKDGKPEACPECDGSGEVKYEYKDSNGKIHYKYCYCPICYGTGKRDDYELVETGRMILPKNCTFQLGDQIIDAYDMTRIVTALRLMGFERMTWKSRQHNANIFEVCDGFTVLIISRMKKGNSHKRIKL